MKWLNVYEFRDSERDCFFRDLLFLFLFIFHIPLFIFTDFTDFVDLCNRLYYVLLSLLRVSVLEVRGCKNEALIIFTAPSL